MRHILRVAVFLGGLCCLFAGLMGLVGDYSCQQSKPPVSASHGAAPTDLPQELLSQWSRFQTALKTDDTKLLAEVTRFPLESNEFGGDIKSAKILAQRYATIFPAKTKQCLLASTLKREEFDGKVFYEVYCDVGAYPIRFIFEQVGPKFFFTGIDNINE